LDRTICADVIDGGVQVSGQVTVASSGVWRTSGTGSFINTTVSGTTIKTITATYVPSATDTSGAVVLTLESSGNLSSGGAICIQESDAMTLTFIPEPVVNANANGTCVSTTGIGLTGQVSQDPTYYPSASGQWSSSGTGTFAPDAFTGVATYVPSASDINNGSVTITWSSIGAASCQPNTRSLLLNTAPLPLADAGADQFTCNNAIVNLNASPYGVGSTYEWALLGNAAGTAGSGLSREVTVVGSYVLTLTDRFGCQNTDTVVVNTVTIPAALALAPQDCYDYYLFLQLTPQPTNLDPRGSFQWSYGGVLMSGENKDSVRVHSPGVYSLEYTFGACEAAFGSTEVNDVPRVRTPDFIGCSSASVFANVELINDTVPNYTFQWFNPSMALVTTTNDDATQVSLPTSTQVGFDTLTYYVRVTDGNGCDVNDSVWVISVPRPVPGLSTDSLQCETLLLDIDGSIPPQSNVDMLDPFNPVYRWYETSNASVTLDTDTMLTTGTTGFYVFEVTVGQCVGDDTINLRFQPYPGKVLPTDVTQCFERATTALLDAGDGGIPATNADFTAMHYDWNGAGTGIDDTLRTFTVDQSFFTTDVEDLTYTVDLSAQYSYLSCPVTDTIQVHDVCAPRLFPPTAFHPGDANTQDGVFTVKGKYFTNYKIRIFNRWGEVIFSSEDVNESWDGTYRGELMPVGVYAFMITYTGKADEYEGPFAKEGRVVLIR
ncbi:MAG: gliding motility-associated C-terminal domain-containing protein, partial [Cytophagaceae bacterium]|nr:gliding motility-associated C-terminal domain-containing protein [Cytophagaceae bacterium]